MLLTRFYDEKLAQASYLVGCQATGEAVVVDPNRDVDQYVRAAAEEGFRVSHVTETHIHADFASGALELAHRTGAQLLLSDCGGSDWKYAFAQRANARLLRDGDVFMIGNIRFAVMHTPGHTPEHISLLVTDTPATDQPIGALTGDFLFVGDVGRPDLLEKAAKISGSMEAGARDLFRSLQRFKQLPDHLQIWPGHGAGSACGKALGAMPTSTLGYERISNWAFSLTDENQFVEAVLSGQPDPPRYFAEMKRINKAGPRILGDFTRPEQLSAVALRHAIAGGTTVVDLRPATEFAEQHIPGTVNIPENRSFTNWAGWLLPYDAPFALIGSGRQIETAVRDLAMIGLDKVLGAADVSVISEWTDGDTPASRVPQVSVSDLSDLMRTGSPVVVDVRASDEWAAGHLPGARNIPLGHLAPHASALRDGGPVYVLCQSGGRSSIAASVLQSLGVPAAVNVSGGFTAWQRAGLPVVRDDVAPDR